MNRQIWSVQIANDWMNDTFNGTREECIEWCRKMITKLTEKKHVLQKY